MADNTVLDIGSGGDTIHTDDLLAGTYKMPTSKIIFGASGVNDGYWVAGAGAVGATTGRVTLASDDPAVALLGTIDTDTSALAGCVGGTELQVDVVSGGGGTEYTEGATDASITGTAMLMEGAADALVVAQGTAADGLLVNLGGNNDVTLATLPDTASSDLASIAANTANLTNCIVQDDSPFTPATGYLIMIGGEFDDAAPDSVDEGDAGNVRITANRSFHTVIRDNAGNERGLNVDANGEIGVTLTNATLPAGTNAIGKLAANSGVDIGDVDVLSIAAGTNVVGGVFTSASTSSTGTSTFYDNDLDETKIEVTDNPTVRIYQIVAFNTTAGPLFLQLFDLDADSVTVGVTVPTNEYVIPGNADSDGAGFVITFPTPKAYSTGFTVACTTDSRGSGAPSLDACIVNIEYVSAA